MRSSISALEERGCDVAWLGVWEKNPRAIAFYRKLGFSEVGEHAFQLGTDSHRDVIMALPLEASGVIT
jgi:diamine N-acetyltransferase